MKISRLILVIVIVILGGLLSGCAGDVGVATSWPGLRVDGDTVYLASNQHVYAIDVVNGTEKWRFPTEADGKISFFADPAVTDDQQLLVGGYHNILYSLNPQNGQENPGAWPFLEAEGRYIAGPLVQDQRIYAPSADNNLFVLDSQGNRQWIYTTGNPQWATPATDGQKIYLSSMDHRIHALDARSGQLIWKSDELGGAIVGTPALDTEGVLYIGTLANQLLALDTRNGSVIRSYATDGWVWDGPALSEGRLYFGDLEGSFYALNAADLSEIWKVQPDSADRNAITETPLVIQDTIYITTESGNLYAIDAANGSTRWPKTVGGKLYSAPVQAGDSILVAPVGADALLIAFDTNGNQKWAFTPSGK